MHVIGLIAAFILGYMWDRPFTSRRRVAHDLQKSFIHTNPRPPTNPPGPKLIRIEPSAELLASRPPDIAPALPKRTRPQGWICPICCGYNNDLRAHSCGDCGSSAG